MRIKAIVTAGALALVPFASAYGSQSQQADQNNPAATQNSNPPSGQTGQMPGAKAGLSRADRDFMMKAAQANLSEIQMAKLAETNASSDAAKTFAKRMIDDHTKAMDQLKDIAQREGVQLPTAPSSDQMKSYQMLQKKTGTEFDRAYLQDEQKDHQKVINEFQKEASQGQNPELRQYAQSTLPTLKMHLDMAQRDVHNL